MLSPLIQSLLDPAHYPHPAGSVELMETHISWVLLAGDYAYKFKKPVVLPFLQSEQATLLQEELVFQQALAASPAGQALPRGPIHADLFRDNVMFDDTAGPDRLCGFFDFYFAGDDTFLFDLAVCLNDWCSDAHGGELDLARASAFMQAYEAERALTHGEVRALPALLRAAALRFWISRLWDWHLPRSAALLSPKDPGFFERVLRHRINAPWHPPR